MVNLMPDTIVQRIDNNVTEAKLEDTVVLLHVENGMYYDFHKTSAYLWILLEEPHTVEDLSKMLAQKYDCTADQNYPDVVAFLHQLDGFGLLHIKNICN